MSFQMDIGAWTIHQLHTLAEILEMAGLLWNVDIETQTLTVIMPKSSVVK